MECGESRWRNGREWAFPSPRPMASVWRPSVGRANAGHSTLAEPRPALHAAPNRLLVVCYSVDPVLNPCSRSH